MNLLYKGNYSRRFERISQLISGKKVTELCFGDTVIAEYCTKNSIQWNGIDIHEEFVKRAQKKGFKAEQQNILRLDKFPAADTCIISGSLYHFHNDIEDLITKMLVCAPKIIISEPVINLSNRKGIIGKLAQGSATINGREQHFRYTEASLTEVLKLLSKKLHFNYKIAEQFNKDLIIIIDK